MVTAAKLEVPLEALTFPLSVAVSVPLTDALLNVDVPLDVTSPVTEPAYPLEAERLVNFPTDGAVLPIRVPSIAPPVMDTEAPKVAAPLETIRPANLPVEGTDAPMAVLSIVLAVIAKA